MSESQGWGSDRISWKPEEVRELDRLMELSGSVHDSLKSYLSERKASQKDILRLVYIIENRVRLRKSVDDFANGVFCQSYGRVII